MDSIRTNATNSKKTISDLRSGEETDVKKTLADLSEAVCEGDLDKILSFYDKSVVAFDMMPPLQFKDLEQYKKLAWEDCFINAFKFPIQSEYHEQEVTVRDDLAVVHGLLHTRGDFLNGEKMEAWMRNTTVLARQPDGRWLIVHEHNSAPSDSDGRVLMNLKPEKVVSDSH